MIVLGIETSCDETAVALVNYQGKVLGHQVWSQIKQHQKFGGVVPEIAARAHLKRLPNMVKNVMKEANCSFKNLTAIAATAGPGLIGGVIVGVMVGKALSASLDKPFLAINHLAAHALTPRLTSNLHFPYLLLLTSGGHCQLLLAKSVTDFELLGTTLDDAAGETFDKVARSLGLLYPGGPEIERLAKRGDENKFSFPKPLARQKGQMNFSFSGLKTAALRCIDQNSPLDDKTRCDVSASLQKTVCDIFERTTENALSHLAKNSIDIQDLVLAGGVAANQTIRHRLQSLAERRALRLTAPPMELCTDNGVMIAWAGIEKLKAFPRTQDISFSPRPRWPLGEELPS
ncbi:MAG: tRNA (adenosine(37)-N6)-threonylcarbamoyltransferase complex transferase subunit TsaD [bacterium]|nr:tRNA (adenosine(37)-N6)-threonylcarbamoyltransferase complex transferase subunit TsaD [bacterium]